MLIKCCCYNISGQYFKGVVIVIADKSEQGMVFTGQSMAL